MGRMQKMLFQQAVGLVRDPSRLQSFLKEGAEKAEGHRKIGGGFLAQLRSLFRLTKAYTKGEYRAVPLKSLLAALGALLYFVNPMDLIPDLLLGGLLDDAAVVGMVLASLKSDLERFQGWENSKKEF